MKTINLGTVKTESFEGQCPRTGEATVYGEGRVSDVLSVDSGRGYSHRFGVGFVPRGTVGNKEVAGGCVAKVEGPWAYAFGKSTCIADNPAMSTAAEVIRNKAAGLEHAVVEGDRVVVDGEIYEIRITRRGIDAWIELAPVPGGLAEVQSIAVRDWMNRG